MTITDAQLAPTRTAIGDTLDLLALCLCGQIAADGLPAPCFCGVLPGNEFPIKAQSCRAGNGIAYVRLINTYPSVQVGVAHLEPANCAVGHGLDIEVGIYRCYPLQRDGSNPPPEVMLEAAHLQYADERAMRRAIACCDWIPSTDYVVGQYIPQGPAGGLIGGTLPISAMLMEM